MHRCDELLRPTYICRDFDDIPFRELAYQQGKRFLIVDFHQTLYWIWAKRLDPIRLAVLKRLLENEVFEGIAILCNAVIPGRWTKTLSKLTSELEQTGARVWPIELILPWTLKPRPEAFQRALRRLGATAQECVVIGDQLFTDILGGNRLGMTTVLVEPLGRDPWWNTIRRRRQREQRILNRLGLLRCNGTLLEVGHWVKRRAGTDDNKFE